MSRDPYNTLQAGPRGGGGVVSSGRIAELPTVDRSPSREYVNRGGGGGGSGAVPGAGRHYRSLSQLAGPHQQQQQQHQQQQQQHLHLLQNQILHQRQPNHHQSHQFYPHYPLPSASLLANSSIATASASMHYDPTQSSSTYHQNHPHNSVAAAMGSPYYRDMDEPTSPAGGGHHRSRSASRPPITHAMDYPRTRYQSLDRGGLVDPHDREFMPIREPRDRSRERSMDRGLYLEDDLYGRQRVQNMGPDRAFIGDLQHQHTDLQRELGNLKRELDLTNQKLSSSMHSIKTFWSPELKKERALRKEESAKYSLINDQLKLLNSENQKQAMLVRQLEEELRMRMRQPNIEMQQQMEAIYGENEHLQREIAILRDTIKELELRIETQKQTLQARDESIKKLLEMLQSKGMGKEEERQMFQQMQAMAQKQMFSSRTGPSTSSSANNTSNNNNNSAVSASSTSAAAITCASSPQPPPDLIGSLMLSSSGILDALLPSIPSTTTCANSASQRASQQHHHQQRNSYSSNFLPTDFYRPLSGTLPRRRYSFGGLPDFGEQQISNLLNETSRSISRSMQILYDNRENIELCEIKKALDIDPRPELAASNNFGGGLCNALPDHSNLLAMGANFYSHPNIYTPPGGIYGSGQLKYQSPSAAAALFGPSPLSPSVPLQCQLATGSGPLFPSAGGGYDLLSSPTTMALGGSCRRYKPNVNYLFSKPVFSNGGASYAYPPPFNNNAGSYYNQGGGATSGYHPWNGPGVGNPLSLNQRLMAGLDCSYPSSAAAAASMRNYHYGSHPTISKYSNSARNMFHSNYFPNTASNLTSSAINATTSCYPPPSFLHDGGPLASSSSSGAYNNQFSSSSSPGYNSGYNHPSSFLSQHQQQHQQHLLHQQQQQQMPLAYRHGPFSSSYGGGSGFQHPPRSLPLSYYPAYKMGSGGGFYNATRHGGGGGGFNVNSLSRVGNYGPGLGAGGGSAGGMGGLGGGDMKRQVSFKFDVDQLSIGS